MEQAEFDPTDEEFLIIYGLKELKDLRMQAADQRGLDSKCYGLIIYKFCKN